MLKTDQLTNTENISLSDEIGVVAPTATPLVTLLANLGNVKEGTGKHHVWTQKDLDFSSDTDIVEGGEPKTANSVRKEMNNVMQIFAKATSVSGTAQATTTAGAKDLFASEVEDRLIELKVALEKAIINGEKDDAGASGVRKMQGIKGFVKDENKVAVATNGEIVEGDILGLAQKLFEQGNESGNLYVLISPNNKAQVDAIYKDNYTYTHATNDFGLVVSTITTNYGVLNFVVDRYVNDDEVIAFNADQVNLVYLQGREPHYEELAKTGDHSKGMVVAESTLEVLSENAVASLTVVA